jgi:hypothetical protein
VRILHRIACHATREQIAALRARGVRVEHDPRIDFDGLVTFDIAEDDPAWDATEVLRAQERCVDLVRTEFTRAEIDDAAWLELRADWQGGYPEPDPDALGFRNVTFDTSPGCLECGAGWRQIAPFRVKQEPAWGRRTWMSLYGVPGRFFVRRDAVQPLLAYGDLAVRTVEDVRGRPLDTIVQIEPREEVDVDVDGLVTEICSACRRVKFNWAMRGESPGPIGAPRVGFARSRSHFGTGAEAGPMVIVSGEMGRLLRASGMYGVRLRPARASL